MTDLPGLRKALAIVALRFKLAPHDVGDVDAWTLSVYIEALDIEAEAHGR